MAWILAVLCLAIAYVAIWRTRSSYGAGPFSRQPFSDKPFSRDRRRGAATPQEPQKGNANDSGNRNPDPPGGR